LIYWVQFGHDLSAVETVMAYQVVPPSHVVLQFGHDLSAVET